MDEDMTYIKVFRKIQDSPVNRKSTLFHLFINLLLDANFREKTWMPAITGKSTTEVKIGRGQLVFGRNIYADKLNLPPSTIRNLIKKLELLEMITQKQDTHYTVITICNYDLYQKFEKKSGQAKDTPKECKECKEEKECLFHSTLRLLNEKTKSRFRSSPELNGRIADGATKEELEYVVNQKCLQWLNTDYATNLNPKTLFGPENFARYRDAAPLNGEHSQPKGQQGLFSDPEWQKQQEEKTKQDIAQAEYEKSDEFKKQQEINRAEYLRRKEMRQNEQFGIA